MKSQVPDLRIRTLNDCEPDSERDYVLYWMTAFRRTAWNFSLDRSIEWASHLHKPLVIFEPLRCDYPWASDRLHRFVQQGMVDNARSRCRKPVHYYPYLEPKKGAGRGLLAVLAKNACTERA